MKKPNRRTKKRRRPKKNAGTSGVEKNLKGVATKDRAIKPVAQIKTASMTPKKVLVSKGERGKQGKGLGYYIGKAVQFLREAKTELKKVKWPNRKELIASTTVVIFLVLIVALFLGVVDFGLIKIIKNIVG